MHKNKIVIFIILIGMLFISSTGQAAELKKIAQTGMKWLSIPLGARGSALGGAYTAVANDAGSVFWNPAGIAYTHGGHVYLTQTRWIADINVNAGALTYRVSNIGVFGVSFATADWGDLNGTRRANNEHGYVETGTFSPTDWFAGLSYARQISSRFAVGGQLKYLYEKLGSTMEGSFDSPSEYTADMNVVAFDFGTYYYTGYKDFRIAMTLQNFSQEKKYRLAHFPLPLTFKFGVAMDITRVWMEESPHNLTLAIDALHPRDYSERLHFGLEYSFRNMVFLRGGYKTNYDEEDYSFGAGLQYGVSGLAVGIDYSYQAFTHFDAVHMFSFDFRF
ncbi:MAG: PorV/PorQ family protein [Calditrichia bacterium]